MCEIKRDVSGCCSIDKPWEKAYPNAGYKQYNAEYCKKTAWEMIKSQIYSNPQKIAYKFYGRKITNRMLIQKIEATTNAYKNLGIKNNEIVFMLCVNTPEMVYSMYALNRIGAITEWFNPLAISPVLLRKYILESNVKYIFAIDLMYEVIKQAIQGTNVKYVVINSVKDALPYSARCKYDISLLAASVVYSMPYMKKSVALKQYAIKNKTAQKIAYYNDDNKSKQFINWADFIKKGSSKCLIEERKYEQDKITFIVHTGGTTGPVKRIAHADYAINSAVYQASLVPIGLYGGMKSLHIVPPIVAFGLENTHLERFYNMEVDLISTYDKEEFVPLIKKYKPNLLVCVPSFTRQINDKNIQLNKKDDLSFITTLLQGGEAFPVNLDKEVDDTLKRHGATLTSRMGFGQNEEFGAFTVSLHKDSLDKKYGTCGVPLPGNEVLIYDIEQEKELKYGKNQMGEYNIGELFVYGATLMKGYYGSDAIKNQTVFRIFNGKRYFDTGDKAYVDEEGDLHWVTRDCRIIRTQDGKIFTNVIENIINSFEEVRECCVVAAPHPQIVKQASCHIVLEPQYYLLCQDEYEKLINDIIERVEAITQDMYSYYIPGTYEFRKERLPYTSFGKIAYKELENLNNCEYEKNERKGMPKIRIRK